MKKSRQFKLKHFRLTLLLVLNLLFAGTCVFAQTYITRSTFNSAPLVMKRKYVTNMPQTFLVSNLINYPVGRTPDDTRRPGVTYMTVYDFYYNVLPGVRLDALTDPAHYFIARDSTSIPPLRIIAPSSGPGPEEIKIKQ